MLSGRKSPDTIMSKNNQIGLLIVDDEPNILNALSRLFRLHDYTVFFCDNASDGLSIIEKEAIGVVISDMKMPLMNGVEFLSLVSHGWPDIQRIVLTGQSDLQETVNAINSAGIFRFISKPWDEDELVHAVQDAFSIFNKKQERKAQAASDKEQYIELKTRNNELTKTVKKNENELELTNNKLEDAYAFKGKLVEEKNKAEKLSEEKSRFLATMSHEMRSPLNAVIAMNALLLESDLTDEQRELAKIAHDGGQTLLALINDILDFSKIEAGNLKLSNEWFNIVEVVQSVVELMASQTIDKDVEIQTVFYPDTPVFLLGDQNRVRQILVNIINNAVKFTEVGGVVVKVKSIDKNSGIEFVVDDTGIGISNQEQKSIFLEFVQADNSESRAFGGTGLGLSICKQLCTMMNGNIGVESQPGVGSSFRVTLPLESSTPLFHPLKNNAQHLVCIESDNKVLVSGLSEQLAYFNRTAIDLDAISSVESNYHSYTYIVDLCNDKDLPADYVNHLKEILAKENQWLSGKEWKLVGLVSSDGIGKLQQLKRLGFETLIRKPARLASIAKHILQNKDVFDFRDLDDYEDKEKKSKEEERKKYFDRETYRILLAEDSTANQAIVKAVLRNKNYEIDIANDGLEAFELSNTKFYHAILMDVSMPNMDGITCTKNIRSKSMKNQNTTIIAMTAKAFAEDKNQCFDAGMNHYVSKPINASQFVKNLNKWIKNSIDESPNPSANVTKASERPGFEGSEKLSPKIAEMKALTDASATSSTKKDESVIDEQTLEQLIKDTSKEILPEILGIYFSESEKRVPEMVKLFEDESWALLEDQAHALKSSSGSFGARRLQEVARKIELLTSNNEGPKLQQDIQTLTALYEKTISELKRYCDNL